MAVPSRCCPVLLPEVAGKDSGTGALLRRACCRAWNRQERQKRGLVLQSPEGSPEPVTLCPDFAGLIRHGRMMQYQTHRCTKQLHGRELRPHQEFRGRITTCGSG